MPESPYSRHVLHRAGGLLIAAVLQASCGPADRPAEGPQSGPAADDAAALRTSPVPVASPAREGSGEAHLSPTGDGGVLMSWLEPVGRDRWALRVARLDDLAGGAWSSPVTVVEGEDLFVNWADFPSVTEIDGQWIAHWLERGATGGYDYGVRVATSADRGESWRGPHVPHRDGTPTEHGFVSVFPHPGGGAGLVWLDGRKYARGPEGGEPTEEMTVRATRLPLDGEPAPSTLLDARACDCCQTDAVVTATGPLVVYRDRTEDEIRDIHAIRWHDGRWSEGGPVHRDGWRIGGCPVNGPAAAARGSDVVVAWFTAPADSAAVEVVFSDDAGEHFGAPVRVDDGDPVGRVDVVLLEDGSAMVSWIERVGSGAAELRVRRVRPAGSVSAASSVAPLSAARASGFPRMIERNGTLLFAWTDVREGGARRVELARAEVTR